MQWHITHENRAAFLHSKNLTAHFSKSFYISTKMLPRERRWATFALYGFCRYADNLIDNPRNRTVDEILREADFLMEEIKVAYRTGESEHPILKPFIQVAKHYGIPMEYPLDLLRGVKMDIRNVRYQTFEDLHLFAYRVAGVVGLMMTYVLGYKTPKAFHYAEELGIAMQLTNILRDIKEDKDMGRIYLPLEELRRFGVSERDVLEENMTPQFRELMKFQVERADGYYHDSDKGIKLLAPESRFAIYSASKIYHGILHKIEAQDFNPFLGRVFVPQMKKMGILAKEVVRSRVEVIREWLLPPQYELVNE